MVPDDRNPYEVKSSAPALPLNNARVTSPQRALLGSLLVMLPWPMLGIAACVGLSLFEKSSEAIFMFGGVTMFFLLPLGLYVSSEWIFGVLIGAVWLAALVLPLLFATKSIHAKSRIELIFLCQAIFSAIQAGLGFLLIVGKQC